MQVDGCHVGDGNLQQDGGWTCVVQAPLLTIGPEHIAGSR